MAESAVDKRWRITLEEIMNARGFSHRNNAVPKILDCEFCDDLKNEGYSFAWSNFKIYSGLERQWISEAGFERCRKQDASYLLFVGEKGENGYYINGKYKHFWLRTVQ